MNALHYAVGVAMMVGSVAGHAAAQDESDEPVVTAEVVPLARFEADAALQVFPTMNSPHYDESLAAGTVVRVGRAHAEFREILLPHGVRGFVHKKFTSELADGAVSSSTKLAFRYRPQTGEAPVEFVDPGVEFRIAGEQDDWWIVRYDGGSAWVPEASIVIFDDGSVNPTLAAAWAELGRQHAQACDAAVASMAARQAAIAAAEARRVRLTELRTQFHEEMGKPDAEQDYAAVREGVDVLIADASDDEEFVATATRFRERIDLQAVIVEATVVANSEPRPAMVDVPASPRRDPLAKFDAIGWIEIDNSWNGETTIRLTKGGQLLHELVCSSGKYDLQKFSGLEVGMVGPRDRPSLESVRVLDVERIEVLSAPR